MDQAEPHFILKQSLHIFPFPEFSISLSLEFFGVALGEGDSRLDVDVFEASDKYIADGVCAKFV